MRTVVSMHMRRCALVYMSSEGAITTVKNDLWVSLQLQPVNLLLLYLRPGPDQPANIKRNSQTQNYCFAPITTFAHCSYILKHINVDRCVTAVAWFLTERPASFGKKICSQ